MAEFAVELVLDGVVVVAKVVVAVVVAQKFVFVVLDALVFGIEMAL